MKVQYVDSDEKLEHAIKAISGSSEIGLDLEFDRNSFGYGFVMCLIQVSTREDVFLIDPISIDSLDSLYKLFENDAILKVIHNASEDVLLLKKYGCEPRNIWDTEKAAMILNEEKIGLSSLLEKYFDRKLDKGVQRTNWRQRPLSEEQLSYASEDVRFLLSLKEQLEKEIISCDKEDWMIQEGLFIEQLEMKDNPNPYLKYKDARKLSPEERNRLRALYDLREILAESLDLPPYKIMRNEVLVDVSKKEYNSLNEWKKMKGAHPQFRSGEAFERFKNEESKAVESGADNFKRKRKDQKLEENLKLIRNSIRDNYGEQCTKLIISQAVINEILEFGGTRYLKPYVREILFETADDLGMDLKKLK